MDGYAQPTDSVLGAEVEPASIVASSGMNSPTVTDLTMSSVSSTERIYRHRLPVRVSHWLNVPFLIILIMSGLQIFNAHPALYWGDRSDREQALLSIKALSTGNGDMKGVTTILGHQFETTGVLGYSDGMRRAFPAWATIPSAKWLAMGRQWHLFFAWLFVINGLIFTTYALASRHVTHDLVPSRNDWRSFGKSLRAHLFLKQSGSGHTKGYNVLQKVTYTTILLVVAPLIVLTGLAMSPTIDTAVPWLLTALGGRQAARTIHFITCLAFVGFILTHVIQVIATGFINNICSMVTGWFTVKHMKRRGQEFQV
jgi:thiosulfate reductase cytochrome b subunit